MEKINFSDCTLSIMEETFGLIPFTHNAKLSAWIETTYELTPFHIESVDNLCGTLQENVEHWNEYDISLHFIGPMFSLVKFTQRLRFNLFAQRNLEAEVQQIKLMGRVDEVVASGYRSPKLPFFAFNEYKKETDPDGDPGGQVLAAMLVGQQQNISAGNDFPVYGCYVIGRNWFFTILEGKKYTTSNAFNSTKQADALQILRILFQLKLYCMERTAHIIVEN